MGARRGPIAHLIETYAQRGVRHGGGVVPRWTATPSASGVTQSVPPGSFGRVNAYGRIQSHVVEADATVAGEGNCRR